MVTDVALRAIAAEIRVVAREVLEREIEGDPTLAELELDSLQRINLAVALEDRFRVILSDLDAETVPRLSDLAQAIAERGGAPS